MDGLKVALEKVRACEAAIREQIAELLAARRYDQVADLAVLAGRLAEIGNARGEDVVHQRNRPSPVEGSLRTPMVVANSVREKATQYPRFERHGNRLVKIGWSKRDKSEYEHKASFDAVSGVASKLLEAAQAGGMVRVEDLLPVHGQDGEEVPSYQVYLVVAWMRELGALERVGNEGYRVSEANLSISSLWEKTIERR
ncbi:MAG: hypothetical protein ACK6DI_12460 [Betaproteobacteria bacterium]|jgi:hypothetical protein